MFGVDTVAAGVLTSFLASMLTEGVKYYINNIREDDKQIKELRQHLDDQIKLLESTKSLKNDYHINSELPPDWLSELERCRYDIEDIEESMELESKKEFIKKFLSTYIRYVNLINNKPAKEKQEEEAGHSDSLDVERQAYELLDSRKEYKSKIIEELISTSTTTNPFGVSIIGMGGIGKTVLARAIEDDASIKSCFPIMSTPPQAPNFNRKTVLAHIKETQLLSNDKRALIILDGMHWVNPEDWNTFRSQCQKILHPESKVLITSQNPKLADVTGTSKYCLHPLKENECFSMILNLANENRNLSKEDKTAITQNKKKLVDASKGLPLLVRQIGIVLAAEAPGNRRSMITEITKRSLWEVPDLVRVLAKLELVSLVAQRPNLRRCLAYCSLFPPDHEFEQDELAQFWMAEGFTQPSTDAAWMKNTTKGYFDDLLSCSLFQPSAPPGEQQRYKLHRLFYDMALNVASRTFCQKHIGKSNSTLEISDFTRHMSLSCENCDEIDIDNLVSDLHRSCSSLRTFLFVQKSGEKMKKNPTFFQRLKRLRVLDLRYTKLTKLETKSISDLEYLRYLDISYTPVKKLPTLSKSPKLQVLKLRCCTNLKELHHDLKELTSLITLEVNSSRLASLPPGIGKLIKLQRLDVFIVGEKEGFKITELRNLNDLRKSLRITNLEKVKTKQEAQAAMLHDKDKLDRLELEWSRAPRPATQKGSTTNDTAEKVLQGLKPPTNLTELVIRNYYGAGFPDWLSDEQVCGSLKSIHLDHCKALPLVDQLELLKTLRLEAMHEESHCTPRSFPYIETLVLCDMLELGPWIDLAASCMPSLRNLQVYKCQRLVRLPKLDCLESLEKLELSWCTMLGELPTLPQQSLKILTIENSDILGKRCQAGGADWHKIRGILLVIDSTPVDTSNLNPTTAGHQNSSIQGTPNAQP